MPTIHAINGSWLNFMMVFQCLTLRSIFIWHWSLPNHSSIISIGKWNGEHIRLILKIQATGKPLEFFLFFFNVQFDGDLIKMKPLDGHLISVQYSAAFGKLYSQILRFSKRPFHGPDTLIGYLLIEID